mgnify:CR=1 FL=1
MNTLRNPRPFARIAAILSISLAALLPACCLLTSSPGKPLPGGFTLFSPSSGNVMLALRGSGFPELDPEGDGNITEIAVVDDRFIVLRFYSTHSAIVDAVTGTEAKLSLEERHRMYDKSEFRSVRSYQINY